MPAVSSLTQIPFLFSNSAISITPLTLKAFYLVKIHPAKCKPSVTSRVSLRVGDSCQCPLLPVQGDSFPYSQRIQFKRSYRRDSIETGWDLRPGTIGSNAAMPVPGHISPPAKSTKKRYGTKNNCVRAQGKSWAKKIQRDKKNPSATF